MLRSDSKTITKAKRIILMVALAFCSCGGILAQPVVNRTWVGEDFTYFRIEDSTAYWSQGNVLMSYQCALNDSAMHFWELRIGAFNSANKQVNYYLHFIRKGNDSLIVTPFSREEDFFTGGKS